MGKTADVLRGLVLSDSEIASRSRLPIEKVRAFIKGVEPNLSELRALARGLRIPLRVFAMGQSLSAKDDELGLLFRSTPGKQSGKYEVTVEMVAGFIDAALTLLPERTGLPSWLNSFDFKDESYAEAHRLAYQFRELFMPGREDEPITDLAQVLARADAAVIGRLSFSQYEGVSVIAGGHAFIFVSSRFRGRMLFTLAHELGHLIAHHKYGHAAIFERASSIGSARARSRAEGFVDAFASILLLPDQGVGRTLKKVREVLNINTSEIGDIEILLLARIYGVSFEVAARRCENLDLLPAGGAMSLVDEIKRLYGSPERRAKSANLPPRAEANIPRVSDNLLLAAIKKLEIGDVSAGWISDHLGISIEELYAANAEPSSDHRLHH